MLKKNLITIGIIIGVILLATGILYLKSIKIHNPSEEIVKCIGEKATLYVQEGCPHCSLQIQKFGNMTNLLTIIDCTKTPSKCIDAGITNIPTWIIDGKKIKGTYSIDELKNMTKC